MNELIPGLPRTIKVFCEKCGKRMKADNRGVRIMKYDRQDGKPCDFEATITCPAVVGWFKTKAGHEKFDIIYREEGHWDHQTDKRTITKRYWYCSELRIDLGEPDKLQSFIATGRVKEEVE